MKFIPRIAYSLFLAVLAPSQMWPNGADGTARFLSAIPEENQAPAISTPVSKDERQSCQSAGSSRNRGLFRRWLGLSASVQPAQPGWLSPLATTSGRLKREFRYDLWTQPASPGKRTYFFGGNKGLELVTTARSQVLLGVPTYTLQTPQGPPGGFGDLPLMLKVRIASAEESEGNYLLTFLLAATVPTGAHRYGSGAAVLTPTLAFGKGWRRFDAQSTIAISLPAASTTRLGRQLLWNTALQYRAQWKLWPELEVNSTFFRTGTNAGQKQTFFTPGAGFGRLRINKDLRFSTAVGMQIAATRFHTYNHRWMFSERVSF